MDKKFFFGLLLFSLGVQVGLHFYLSNKKQQEKSDVSVQEGLHLEVDFIKEQEQHEHKEEKVFIETPFAKYTFSNYGAVISDLVYKRSRDTTVQDFTILSHDDAVQDRELRAFLVALDSETPYHYECTEIKETDEGYSIAYATHNNVEASITKQFFVHKKTAQVDMMLTVNPIKPTKVRILWPSPLLKDLDEEEVIDGFFINQKNKFQKIIKKNVKQEAFEQPQLFGVENKYFVFSMINDTNKALQRAYFKDIENRLIAILETMTIEKETIWKFNFYMGPKQATAMVLVDKRLEKVFDYGFFAFITKPLLFLLRLITQYVSNYGIAIILATLLLKILLLPITWSGPRKMKKLEEYQRKMTYLEQKYKGDKAALDAARAELLQKDGIPLGGCLPLLIQLPFFMALQSGLNNSFELFRAPFVWWIKDLSVADPFYVLPVLTLIVMLSGGIFGQKGANVRQNIATLIMAIVFFAFTSGLAAGLCLFILVNAALHGLQTWLQKKIDVA